MGCLVSILGFGISYEPQVWAPSFLRALNYGPLLLKVVDTINHLPEKGPIVSSEPLRS